MKKKILSPLSRTVACALLLAIILGISAIPAFAASNLAATPTASTVYLNGAAKAFEAYNINGNNYFKLRDLAYVLNGTVKQFEVGYDNATKAITLMSGKAYTSVGGEMAPGDGKAKSASPTASKIYLNGKELNLTVYLIGGNNFFKLRDLMEAIDVFVGYDNATKAITLDTSMGYVPEGNVTTPPEPTTTPAPITEPAQTTPSGGSGTFQLGIFEGYDFQHNCVVSYVGNPEMDTDFYLYYQWRTGISSGIRWMYVYLGAMKICVFDNPPQSVSVSQIEEWENYVVNEHAPGKFYVIRSRDGRYYLLQLLDWENQDKSQAYWIMTFEWQEISVS